MLRRMTAPLSVRIFTIYENPADCPGLFVVRERVVAEDANELGAARTAETLEEARSLVPPGADRIDRSPDDDSSIVESWALPG
jgi:hypothetical protein